MKLFQQLLLAPAALGLLAPLAANAAEVNINDVASYARKPVSQMRAAKATQFSDVVPGDWAYTALLNLSESYGCVDSAYTQNLKSGQSLTRYEAAALVNSCVQGGVASVDANNSDVLRLTKEFGTEMAILKGRVDGLEYKVQELSAGQFSPSTKLTNQVVFNLGYVDDDRNAVAADAADPSRVHSTYVFESDLTTSFTGEDKLFTRFATGNNVANDVFVGRGAGDVELEASNANGNAVNVDQLWYSNNLGDNFRYWAGPLVMSETMLASSPSIYKNVTNQFDNGGNASTYGSGTQPGFGIAWVQEKDDSSAARWEVSSNYISVNGNQATTGVLTDSNSKWLSKVGYGSSRWQVSLAMAKNNCTDPTPGTANDAENCTAFGNAYATTDAQTLTGNQTSYAVRGYWTPESSGIVPAIQLGYDWSTIDDDGTNATGSNAVTRGSVEATQAWMAGLVWEDAFIDGNTAGIAFGHPEHATDYVDVNFPSNDPANKAFAWEAYYDYNVNDGITITPSIFGFKDATAGNAGNNDGFGGLIQTTFKF